MLGILSKFLNTNQRELDNIWPIVAKIGQQEESISQLSDRQLSDKTTDFKKKLQDGQSLESILPEAFACVREASKRTTGMRHYDVQLLAGAALFRGKIAEQKTGEGKTLSATTALYLRALVGQGAHLVTVNDYLAKRDAEWMGPIFHALGMSVGVINHEQSYLYDPNPQTKEVETAEVHLSEEEALSPETGGLGTGKYLREVTRKEAYQADITYGTNNEFGFDYLRDNMVRALSDMAQRGHYFAIVDEVDSVLIDEARTPLIISAPDTEPTDKYYEFSKIVSRLNPQADYVVDEKLKSVHLTDGGIVKIEQWLQVDNLYEKDFDTLHHIEQALKARTLFQKDRDYIVRDGAVVIVDEFTGRLMFGRRFSEGLHQAIEAREGVKIQQESKTLATISFQNYFRMYQYLGGMTGTAATAAEEFHKIYKLDVLVVPTNKTMIRQDLSDAIYKTAKIKFQAVAAEIEKRHQAGQPVLIGTTSIDKNELVSQLLTRKRIKHQILNAKNHQKEAQIISQAGQKGAVTVATNIAGRGVDIKLGDGVVSLGGLHIIGTERHEARRIDDQLRGRAGRQGDPGSSQFFVSLEDDIMRLFGGSQVAGLMTALKIPDDMPISHGMISRAIESAQNRVEGHNFDIRKHVVEYDDVINKQRQIVYGQRKKIIEQSETQEDYLRQIVLGKLRQEISGMAILYGQEGYTPAEVAELIREFCEIIPFDQASRDQITSQIGTGKSSEEVSQLLWSVVEHVYNQRLDELGNQVMIEVEKFVLLEVVDRLWIEHLDAVDDLREGIGLRGYAQRDPLVEYKAEAFGMFEKLMKNIDYEVARRIFKVQVAGRQTTHNSPLTANSRLQPIENSSAQIADQQAVSPDQSRSNRDQIGVSHKQKLGRNDLCWCGSGKKYKRCHYPN
ncbi:preprotein translocase subunit SecA [Candidatus Daviesbacteria bacterium]|nr:preprotein translocase subunit SecA [Candidatus Daviesbacteria bacterium]